VSLGTANTIHNLPIFNTFTQNQFFYLLFELVGNVAFVGLQQLACNLSAQRRLCQSASFFFFQRDFTCTGDGNPEQKVAKSFSISGSLSLAVLPFLPARGTLCQRGDCYSFWVQRKRKK
jgi:hypothetical protein